MSVSLRKAMEDELAESPADLATHAAYADLLDEMEDPRGEFIRVQMRLEDPTLEPAQREKLRQREQDLLGRYAGDWLGPLQAHLNATRAQYSLRRGWLDSLAVEEMTLPLARALRDSPLARLLRRLEMDSGRDDDNDAVPEDNVPQDEYDPGLWPLVGTPCLKNLRVFRLGEDQEWSQYNSRCHLNTAAVLPLVRSMPRVEELYLFVSSSRRTTVRRNAYLTDLFALPTLTNLRVLKAYHVARVHRLDVLAGNPAFRNLTHLLLHPKALDCDDFDDDEAAGFILRDGYLPLRMVEALARSPNLPSLTHLQFRLSGMGDAGVRALVESGLIGRLSVLDLSLGCITDEGARMLAGCPAMRRLERLDLTGNSLSPTGVALIRGLGIPGTDEYQFPPVFDDEVGQYLFHGDYE